MTTTNTACNAPRHNTMGAYRRGCRCPAAREAWRLYRKRRREGRQPAAIIDATGTRRRLQALAAIGWDSTALAHHLGYKPAMVGHLQTGLRTRVHVATAQRVLEVYERLSGTPGTSRRARHRADANGWAAPLAWDDIDHDPTPAATEPSDEPDLVLVDLAVAGRPIPRTPNATERQQITQRLLAAGASSTVISHRIHASGTTTNRLIQQLAA